MDKVIGTFSRSTTVAEFNKARKLWICKYIFTQSSKEIDSDSWSKPRKAILIAEGKDYNETMRTVQEQFTAYIQSVDHDLSNDKGSPYLVVDEE